MTRAAKGAERIVVAYCAASAYLAAMLIGHVHRVNLEGGLGPARLDIGCASVADPEPP